MGRARKIPDPYKVESKEPKAFEAREQAAARSAGRKTKRTVKRATKKK